MKDTQQITNSHKSSSLLFHICETILRVKCNHSFNDDNDGDDSRV